MSWWTSCAGSLRKTVHVLSVRHDVWKAFTFSTVRTWQLCARAISGRFYLHSWLVCTLRCARFCNMQMIWSYLSRANMVRLLGTAYRRLWQDWWLGLETWVFHIVYKPVGNDVFFLGNMKIPSFLCGAVRLSFEISLNLNTWEYFLTENLLGDCMRNISSEDATQGLILWKALQANLGLPTQFIYWCFTKVLAGLL
jgi:hypothetical protein